MLALTFQLFAISCGWLEAVLYAQRGAEAFSGNEHGGMTCQRLAAWLLVPVALLVERYLGQYVQAEILPAALLFPLFHDEAYNLTRLWISKRAVVEALPAWPFTTPWALRWLDKWDAAALELAWYEYRYGYQSDSTTARNDFNGRQRTWLAAGGCLLLAVGYWLLLR